MGKKYQPGKFVVLEGIDGAGTTTQVYRLRQRLLDVDLTPSISQEPSRGPIGLLIRQYLSKRVQFDPYTVALLFAADRMDHITNAVDGIETSLQRADVVISDRYFLSSMAYQTLSVEEDFVRAANSKIRLPDLTILVDTPPSQAFRRKMRDDTSREKFDSLRMQQSVRSNYLRYAKVYQEPHNIVIVDGSKDAQSLFDDIWLAVERLLSKHHH